VWVGKFLAFLNKNWSLLIIIFVFSVVKATGEATLGKYAGGVSGPAAGRDLHVKAHVY